ncbi:hypothetical protein PPTG_09561 [Phytophthora nicotianae INRA-310]|uniref:Major facilitator superfamily (MFS) profile domain-containing protein n=1 Tax=Phytophthora nicotianae (strain INRA-310) TaxID=761204 RepID=W2QHB5_PHYN3|nr:hypothetical protein PPTG_09561 [Phytophthora nicotianae INRA-310]ETN11894.1 hypothetical protein PPTG_09561 [Phytophthora nicotianae INRA-310]
MTTPGSPPVKLTHWHHELLWETKLMYALSSAGGSAMFNFLTVYYQHTAGFSKVQIVADRIRNQRLIHIFCIISGSVLWFSLQFFAWSFEWTIFMVMLAQFQRSPGASLLDHAVLNLLDKVGGEYGKQRLFGAVGFGIGAYVTGLAVAVGGIYWSFGMSFILCMSSLLVLRLIPPVRYGDKGYTALEAGEDKENTESEAPASFMENIRVVTKEFDVLVLLGVVFLMGLMYGVLSSFLTLNLYNLSGGDAKIVGVAIMCETASELPAFFFSHKIIKKIGTVNVLLVSIAGYALRISYYAVMTDPWNAIPFEFLHGITFGLAWAAVTQYIYSSTPKGCEGTVMGVLNAIQNGIARATGTLVGGYFYENYGPRVMWLVTDLGVPLSLVGVGVFAYFKNANEAVHEDLLEEAELFSPHAADPQALKSDGQLLYDEIE